MSQALLVLPQKYQTFLQKLYSFPTNWRRCNLVKLACTVLWIIRQFSLHCIFQFSLFFLCYASASAHSIHPNILLLSLLPTNWISWLLFVLLIRVEFNSLFYILFHFIITLCYWSFWVKSTAERSFPRMAWNLMLTWCMSISCLLLG